MAAVALAGGCNTTPPPVNVAVPLQPAQPTTYYPADYPKPLPDQTAEAVPPPSFDDQPLVDQRLPEEAWFVSTYNRVGRPRIAVFVNRTLDGALVGNPDVAISTVDTERRSTGAVDVQHTQSGGYAGPYGSSSSGSSDSFKSPGAAEYHETTSTYLHPGQYDAASLQALDYQEMESLLTDWFHASGQVTLISPGFLRSRLSPQQLSDVESGQAAGLSDIAQATGADVLVQVQAHPVSRQGQLVVLLVAQAVNIKGGEALADASVEMPTPIDRYALNNFTRFLTRKLMHGMIDTWTGSPPPNPTAAVQTPAPAPAAESAAPAPTTPAPAPAAAPPTAPAPAPSGDGNDAAAPVQSAPTPPALLSPATQPAH
jgi:hypothetical protein